MSPIIYKNVPGLDWDCLEETDRGREGGSPGCLPPVCSVDKLYKSDTQKINISLRKGGCQESGSSFSCSTRRLAFHVLIFI